MAFPSTPLDVTVELYIDGAWVNITPFVYTRHGISITRGSADESSFTEPSSCQFTVNNRDGRFSPRNPRGVWFGKIGRNTPVRVLANLGAGDVARFAGEVSAWPVRWDISGSDVSVSIEASGILRRLGQGGSPLRSAISRAATRDASVRAYWPGEDAEGSTIGFASGLSNGAPAPPLTAATINSYAATSAFPGSAAIAAFPSESSGGIRGTVPAYTPITADDQWVDLLLYIENGDTDGSTPIFTTFTNGTAAQIDVVLHSNATYGIGIQLIGYTATGAVLGTTGVSQLGFEPLAIHLSLGITDIVPGSTFRYAAYFYDPNGVILTYRDGGSRSGVVGAVTGFTATNGGVYGKVSMGHIMVRDNPASNTALDEAMLGWQAEAAGRRIERLCLEEGVYFDDSYYNLDSTVLMGAQRPLRFLDLIQECVDADLGILYERRDTLGLGYWPRVDLYNRAAGLALTYGALQELVPTEDDQATRNDIIVSRAEGSSARATLDTGPLSTAAPPAGIGRYDEAVTLNLHRDADLPDQAAWRLRKGTLDEARYPNISLALHSPAFSRSASLTAAALALDQGDRLTITGLPAWLPPETVNQLAQGFTESLSPFSYDIELNCTPASVYQVAALDSTTNARLDAENSALNAAVTATATTVTVTGDLWVTTAGHPADFPFDVLVGGEAMTVTACTGAASPQTFTVTRSVNGVQKAHAAGAPVRVPAPVVVAL